MRRGHKTGIRRTHRKVSWLTQENQHSVITLDPQFDSGVGRVERITVGVNEDNDFVQHHPKFAKRNDIVAFKRIVGRLRLSMYASGDSGLPYAPDDASVHYGLCLVKGEYDNAGAWTPVTELPDPREPGDEDEKWFFKNRAIFSFGDVISYPLGGVIDGSSPYAMNLNVGAGEAVLVTGSTPASSCVIWQTQPLRPAMLSTDSQLPNGSFIDITTRRKAEYTEKLSLLVAVDYGGADPEKRNWFAEIDLRVLIGG